MILICNMTEGDKIRVKKHLYKNYFKNCVMKGNKTKLWKRLMY